MFVFSNMLSQPCVLRSTSAVFPSDINYQLKQLINMNLAEATGALSKKGSEKTAVSEEIQTLEVILIS